MKIRNVIATGVMVAGLSLGLTGLATAAPGQAPNVKGLSESSAVATLEAAGVDVRIATRNGSCALSNQVVHHQQDLSGKTYTKTRWSTSTDPETGETNRVATRTTVVVPPSTTLNMTCP